MPMPKDSGPTLGTKVGLTPEERRIVVASAGKSPREGWAEDARAIAEAGGDAPVWPEFGNDGDDELTW